MLFTKKAKMETNKAKPSKEQTLVLKKIKEKFIELSASSTSHGYPNMFRTKYWSVRIMWLVFFVAAALFCAFMIYRSVNDYLQYDVVTKIKEYSELPTDFPAITICNLNPLLSENSYSILQPYLKEITINIDPYVDETNLTVSQIQSLSSSYEDLLSAKTFALNDAMDPSFNDSNRAALGLDFGKSLIYCKYNGKLCNETDFNWYYMYEYGNCYQFNSGKNSKPIKKSYIAGNRNGLYLELYPYETETEYSIQSDAGLIVFIHNQTSKPVPSEGIKLKSSLYTNILLEKSYTEKYPYPYSDCLDLEETEFDRTYYDAIISSSARYSQKVCFDLCLQNIVIKKCGCYDLKYLKLFNSPPCLNSTQIECSNEEYLNFIDTDINTICDSNCPLECDSQKFEYKISAADFPSEIYKKVLLQSNKILNLSIDLYGERYYDYYITSRLLAVNMYYSNLGYTLISESPKTSIFDIVANIGGIDFCFDR